MKLEDIEAKTRMNKIYLKMSDLNRESDNIATISNDLHLSNAKLKMKSKLNSINDKTVKKSENNPAKTRDHAITSLDSVQKRRELTQIMSNRPLDYIH